MGGPLRFKAHLVTEFVPSEGLFILSEAGEQVFRGPVFARVAQAIDGERSDDELAASLAGELPPAQVYYAIASLRRAGVVVETVSPFGPRETAYWDALGRETDAIAPPRVALVGVGEIELGAFEARLRDLGVTVDPEAERTLVLCDDYLRGELDDIDARARSGGSAWLLAKPLGLGPWIGPLFRPDRPGCWACLAHRLRGHRRVERFLQDHTGRAEPYPTARGALPATLTAVAGLLATALATWANPPRADAPDTDEARPLERVVISLDPRALTSTRHPLTVRPQCPRCGDPGMVARRQLRPITLAATPAALRDGGRRSESPHTTFERLEHHISPITGIVSRMVRSSPPGSEVAHSYYTDHNFVHMTQNLEFLRVSLRSYSGGKGRSEIQAKTGALCESIERYSSVLQGDEAMRVASYAQLREAGEAVVHPNEIMLYSEAQLAERARWNATGELFSWVPEPFDEHAQLPWTPAWSLGEAGEAGKRWVASGLCFYDAASAMMRADSNGSAAGSKLEEAIVQGFMELVERDAVALWWYNRLRLPRVDLASFDEPYFERAVAELAALPGLSGHGRELWVLELPTDIPVPCFVAVSRRVGEGPEAILFGLGAHLDARLAISRAITEHNQFLPHVSTDPGGPTPTSVMQRWYREATLATQPYLAPNDSLPARRRDDYPRYDAGVDLRAEIERCTQMVRERGLELLVQDHTRPDTGLSVAKVIVPGLRHFWARFAPGRLYEVPVELGLLERPTPEAELNPVPIFI